MLRERFDAKWLSLRESVDHRSRASSLLPHLTDGEYGESIRVLDLGAGTGSNMRYLGSRLAVPQDWTLVDHDLTLLDSAVGKELDSVSDIKRVCSDLANLSGLYGAIFDSDIVTASALLDLVSEDWLGLLVDACARGSCRALFSLTYDGSIQWGGKAGRDPGDSKVSNDWLTELINHHQRRDKGFGPSLGPMAGSVAQALFQKAGYKTWLVPSPWLLTASDAEVVQRLIKGWEMAASSPSLGVSVEQQRSVHAWAKERLSQVSSFDFELRVGHVDLLAIPS